ncbi:MAG: excinuclease ABC subunit UvrC [Deltaproteobacteria bacterium]|nr:MAG: excinuclease ABC subunit UvrC [Deltaproteobacteria bacterium]
MVKLLEKAKSLPSKPGCYLMKKTSGEVLYVGKAKSLKARVSSYFNASAKTPKTEILISHVRDFEFLITKNDAEAFVLENNLIKKHSPKYNIRLKDDKSYPYVLVDHSEDFPRLMYVRRFKRTKEKEIFGPFVVGSNISEVLRITTKSFGLRDCSLREFNSRKEPCLLYQMHQCSAPCVEKISKKEYKKDLDLALDLFRGKGKKSLKELEARMHKAAEDELFEKAAMIRDNISILEEFLSGSVQKNVEFESGPGNIDVFGYHVGEFDIDMAIYMVRNGILLGHKNFNFPIVDINDEIEDELRTFLFQYYSSTNDTLPELLFIPENLAEVTSFKEAMKEIEKNIKVKKPTKKYEQLMKLAIDQAFEHQRVRLSNQESIYVGLNKLAELLGMKERPVVLECYDVAIFQGTSPTAAQIVFHNGKPDRKNYRHYGLEVREEGNNDFAMMKELMRRRIPKGNLPDVFIVDGGKGQVSSLLEVLREENIDIPVCGIAKSKSGKKDTFKSTSITKTEERLFIPGRVNPYILSKNMSLFRIVTQMRDEAHRFSRRLHHKKEKDRVISSWLDEVEGIGPKTRKQILERMDMSMSELSELSVLELQNKFEVSEKIALNLFEYLKQGDQDGNPDPDV